MPLEPALICLAGIACWALSTQRLRRELRISPRLPAPVIRAVAILLIGLAAARAIHHFGPYQGPVALVGMLSIAGLLFLLVLSRWPRFAVACGMAMFPVAQLLHLNLA